MVATTGRVSVINQFRRCLPSLRLDENQDLCSLQEAGLQPKLSQIWDSLIVDCLNIHCYIAK